MAESIENQQPKEIVKSHRSRSGFWIGIIIFVVVIALAAAGFYLLRELREEQKGLGGEINKGDMQLLELSHQISGFQEQLAALQKQLATVEGQVASKDERFNKTLADFSKLHQEKSDTVRAELTTALAQIQRQLGKTRGDWLIADAEYLLSIAGQRLHLTGDVATTREALIAADERLRESGDAAAFKVREELAQEIAALDKVYVPDIVGIHASIQSLMAKVEGLALLLPYAGKEIDKPGVPPEDDAVAHSLLDSALGEIQDLVTIRHTEQPVKSILTAEQAFFIKEQLRVKLEMVKIALVQMNEELYKASLSEARQWLKDNFAENANALAFAADLDKLAGAKIRSQMPDISKSLKMLRNITKLRVDVDAAQQPAPAAEPQKSSTPPAPAAAKPAADIPVKKP